MKAPSPVLVVGICLTIAFVNLVTAAALSTPREIGFLIGSVGTPIVIGLGYLAWFAYRHRTRT